MELENIIQLIAFDFDAIKLAAERKEADKAYILSKLEAIERTVKRLKKGMK